MNSSNRIDRLISRIADGSLFMIHGFLAETCLVRFNHPEVGDPTYPFILLLLHTALLVFNLIFDPYKPPKEIK